VDPLRRISWRHEVAESPFERLMSEAIYEIGLTPDDESTRVTVRARIRLRGLSRLGSLQVRRATARRLEEALERRLRLRVRATVLDPGGLPRQELGKAKRVFERTEENDELLQLTGE
jgi:phenylacetate-coenzyme A ligase PaaK-like adenylate-forming protein